MAYSDPIKQREYMRKWVANRRAKWFKDKECKRCGSIDDLQIHHLDPEQKEHHVIWSWSWERIFKEVDKCIVLCKKCHGEYHADQRRLVDIHGTHHGYSHYGCRCEKCTIAHREHCRKYRKHVISGSSNW